MEDKKLIIDNNFYIQETALRTLFSGVNISYDDLIKEIQKEIYSEYTKIIINNPDDILIYVRYAIIKIVEDYFKSCYTKENNKYIKDNVKYLFNNYTDNGYIFIKDFKEKLEKDLGKNSEKIKKLQNFLKTLEEE